jgi:type IV pilus assembly protein PilQ
MAAMNVRNIVCACMLAVGLTTVAVRADDNATAPVEAVEEETEASAAPAAAPGLATNMTPVVTNTTPTTAPVEAEAVEEETEAPAASAAVTNIIPTAGVVPTQSTPSPATGTESMADTNHVATVPATSATPSGTNATVAAESPAQITIDFVDYDLQGALRRLASKAGINLILGEEVSGKVTVHLEDVPYAEAMRLIAESKGYTVIQDKIVKNLVKVKSKESLESEPVEMRVCVLRFAKADDLAKSIDRLLTKQGKTQVDARSNTLIVCDTPSSLTKIMPLIDALDTQTPQVLIEAKFIETTKNPQKDLGINWSGTLLNHSFSARRPSPEKPIASPGGPDPVNQSPFEWSKNLAGGQWVAPTMILDAGEAKVVFSFLNQDSDSELLANPRVVTTDNGKAKISIAEEYPIPQFQFSEQTGAFQISGFQYKDIGIILNVTPRINKDGFVTLEVAPEASSRSGVATLASGASSVQIPIIDTRTASTTVLIKSGNTLAIGGLMRQDTSDTYTKVPLMGDIPGLGPFFRSKSLSKKKRDLLIFLTPTIVGPEAQTGYEKYSGGLPSEEAYANDKWMPRDNAKSRPFFKSSSARPAQPASAPSTH